MFKKYEKIHRLWKPETDWILFWTCYIEEKIDWANLSIWLEDWLICIWSRNNVICNKWVIVNSFNWACEYVLKHEWINKLLKENPDYRLYWEWLIKHTVNYYEDSYRHFYMFDIEQNDKFFDAVSVLSLASEFNIKKPKLLWIAFNPTEDEILKYVWKSVLWEVWEWIVIKNFEFVNNYWNCCYAKVVWDVFKETKYEKNIWITCLEKEIADKFITEWRLQKILFRIKQEKLLEEVTNKDIPKILWYIEYDVLSEEIMTIKKYWIVNFKNLQREIIKKTKELLHQINLL